MDSQAHLRHLKAVLGAGDLRGALMYLNSLTRHRFTSLYRFDVEMLRNVALFDRRNPDQPRCDDLPVLASYCVFVRDAEATFRVDDSHADVRVADHPRRAQLRSYCGVPLLDECGSMFGSLCHFDFDPVTIDVANVALMEALAPWLPGYARTTEAVAQALAACASAEHPPQKPAAPRAAADPDVEIS